VPRDDMNRSPAAQANTFFLSNMAPQISAFNGGIWSRLERLVRYPGAPIASDLLRVTRMPAQLSCFERAEGPGQRKEPKGCCQ
jgi:hypothetical protein